MLIWTGASDECEVMGKGLKVGRFGAVMYRFQYEIAGTARERGLNADKKVRIHNTLWVAGCALCQPGECDTALMIFVLRLE